MLTAPVLRTQLIAWVRRAFRGSQLNQGSTPKLALHAVGRLDVHVCEGPARRRAACEILVNIMPVNSWPGVANWRGSAEPCGVDSSTDVTTTPDAEPVFLIYRYLSGIYHFLINFSSGMVCGI